MNRTTITKHTLISVSVRGPVKYHKPTRTRSRSECTLSPSCPSASHSVLSRKMPANASSTRTSSTAFRYTSFPQPQESSPCPSQEMLSSPAPALPASSRIPKPSRPSKPSGLRAPSTRSMPQKAPRQSLLPKPVAPAAQPASSRPSTVPARTLVPTATPKNTGLAPPPPLHHSQFHLEIAGFTCQRPRARLTSFLRRIYGETGELPLECRCVYPVASRDAVRILFRANSISKGVAGETCATLTERVIDLYSKIARARAEDLLLFTSLSVGGFSVPEKAYPELITAWATITTVTEKEPSQPDSEDPLSDSESSLIGPTDLKKLAQETEKLIIEEIAKANVARNEMPRSTVPYKRKTLGSTPLRPKSANISLTPRAPIEKSSSSTPRPIRKVAPPKTAQQSPAAGSPPKATPASRAAPTPPVKSTRRVLGKKPSPLNLTPEEQPPITLSAPTLSIPSAPIITINSEPPTPALSELHLPAEDVAAAQKEIHKIFNPRCLSSASTVPPTPLTKSMPTPLPSPPASPVHDILTAEVQLPHGDAKPGMFLPTLPMHNFADLKSPAFTHPQHQTPHPPSPPLTIIDDSSSVYSQPTPPPANPPTFLDNDEPLLSLEEEGVLDLVRDLIDEMTREVELREVRMSLEDILVIDRRGSMVSSFGSGDRTLVDEVDDSLDSLVLDFGNLKVEDEVIVEEECVVLEPEYREPEVRKTRSEVVLAPPAWVPLRRATPANVPAEYIVSRKPTPLDCVVTRAEVAPPAIETVSLCTAEEALHETKEVGRVELFGSRRAERFVKELDAFLESSASQSKSDATSITLQFIAEFQSALNTNSQTSLSLLAARSAPLFSTHQLFSMDFYTTTSSLSSSTLPNCLENILSAISAAQITASLPDTPSHTVKALLQNVQDRLLSLVLFITTEISAEITRGGKNGLFCRGMAMLSGVSAAVSAGIMFGARTLARPIPTPTLAVDEVFVQAVDDVVSAQRAPAAMAVGLGVAAVGLSRMGKKKAKRVPGDAKMRALLESAVGMVEEVKTVLESIDGEEFTGGLGCLAQAQAWVSGLKTGDGS